MEIKNNTSHQNNKSPKQYPPITKERKRRCQLNTFRERQRESEITKSCAQILEMLFLQHTHAGTPPGAYERTKQQQKINLYPQPTKPCDLQSLSGSPMKDKHPLPKWLLNITYTRPVKDQKTQLKSVLSFRIKKTLAVCLFLSLSLCLLVWQYYICMQR